MSRNQSEGIFRSNFCLVIQFDVIVIQSQECQYTKSLCSIRDGMKMILRSHAI